MYTSVLLFNKIFNSGMRISVILYYAILFFCHCNHARCHYIFVTGVARASSVYIYRLSSRELRPINPARYKWFFVLYYVCTRTSSVIPYSTIYSLYMPVLYINSNQNARVWIVKLAANERIYASNPRRINISGAVCMCNECASICIVLSHRRIWMVFFFF